MRYAWSGYITHSLYRYFLPVLWGTMLTNSKKCTSQTTWNGPHHTGFCMSHKWGVSIRVAKSENCNFLFSSCIVHCGESIWEGHRSPITHIHELFKDKLGHLSSSCIPQRKLISPWRSDGGPSFSINESQSTDMSQTRRAFIDDSSTWRQNHSICCLIDPI